MLVVVIDVSTMLVSVAVEAVMGGAAAAAVVLVTSNFAAGDSADIAI